MDFNTDCRIYSARAYADVPTSLFGMKLPPGLNSLPSAIEACENLPVGGQKREIEFEA